MSPTPRSTLVIIGLLQAVLALGFATQQGWATWIWPWPDGRLSYVFVGSIFAAIAAPLIFIGWSNEPAAMKGGALNLALTFLGITAYLTFFYQAPAQQPLATHVPLVTGVAGLANLLIAGMVWRTDFRDRRTTPLLVRASFALFAMVLIAVATALLLQTRHVFPWPLQGRTSVLVGWIFLGASAYFIHGLVVPVWGNAKGQLLGFLAYDLVLLMPYVNLLDAVKPERRLSLIVYLGVILFSLGIALYHLALNPGVRQRRSD